jgi:hypothetical protein
MSKINNKKLSGKKSPVKVQDMNNLFNFSSRPPNSFGISGRNNFLGNTLNFPGSYRPVKK